MDLVESYREDLRFARRRITRLLLGLLVAALVVFPLVAPEYAVFIATLVCLYSIGVMGQNLLIGYTGLISFGQAGFLALGAFAFGHLRIWGAPFLLALAGAGLAAAVAGILVGFPSLRLKGPYLAIATLGFGTAVYQIFVNWEVLSGGRSGLAITKDQRIWTGGILRDLDGKVLGTLPGATGGHGVTVTDSGDVYLAQLSGVVQKFVKQSSQ